MIRRALLPHVETFVELFFCHSGLDPESSIFKELQESWTPFFNGVTTFYETIKHGFKVRRIPFFP